MSRYCFVKIDRDNVRQLATLRGLPRSWSAIVLPVAVMPVSTSCGPAAVRCAKRVVEDRVSKTYSPEALIAARRYFNDAEPRFWAWSDDAIAWNDGKYKIDRSVRLAKMDDAFWSRS